MNNRNWNNYFDNSENKYNLKMNSNNPIVIFVDGKNITKSSKYDLISENKKSFNDILEQTIKYFTVQFDCIAISGVDEVSFIIEDSKKLKKLIGSKKYTAHEIVSVFSQNFFKYFNDRYEDDTIYWHCKCSNIPKGKIKSYIKYRSLTILELNLTYFLKKRQFKNAGKIPIGEKKQICDKILEYEEFKKFESGKLYINGEQVALETFLKDGTLELLKINREDSCTFLDLNDF